MLQSCHRDQCTEIVQFNSPPRVSRWSGSRHCKIYGRGCWRLVGLVAGQGGLHLILPIEPHHHTITLGSSRYPMPLRGHPLARQQVMTTLQASIYSLSLWVLRFTKGELCCSPLHTQPASDLVACTGHEAIKGEGFSPLPAFPLSTCELATSSP